MQSMRYRVLVEAIDPSQGPDLVFVMQAQRLTKLRQKKRKERIAAMLKSSMEH